MPPETEFDPDIREKRLEHLSQEGAVSPEERQTITNQEIEARMVDSRRRARLEQLYADGAITPAAFLQLDGRERFFLLRDEDRREAYQMNRLIDDEKVSTFEASDFSREEFDQTLEKDFKPDYFQKRSDPRQIEKRKPGQKAEDLGVTVIERTLKRLGVQGIHIRGASQAQDQGPQRIDVLLEVDGVAEPIQVQVTTSRDAATIERKLEQLRSTKTVFAFLPKDIAFVAELNNPVNDSSATLFVLRQVLEGIQSRPEFAQARDRIWSAFESIKEKKRAPGR